MADPRTPDDEGSCPAVEEVPGIVVRLGYDAADPAAPVRIFTTTEDLADYPGDLIV